MRPGAELATPGVTGGRDALRVTVLSELPTPYRWPLFVRIAARPEIALRVLFYARSEADRDWNLDVASEPEGGPAVEFLEGRTVHVRGRRSLFFHWNPGLPRRLLEGEPHVVVVPGWSMPSSLLAIRTCRRQGIPYVIFSETHALAPRPAWLARAKRPLLRWAVGGASAWLATGSLSADYLAEHGADPERTFRFANTPDVAALALAVEAARPRRRAVREELGVPADAPTALFVGRLIAAKGVDVLLRAQALVERSGVELWTVVVGDGVERETLRQEARRLSIRRLVFTGSRQPSDLPALWAAADLFVLPSRHEPWGAVVNEAMAAGLPLVLTDRVGAAPDLLADGVNGRLVPAGDEAALAAALADLAARPELRDRMADASSRRIADWGHDSSVEGFLAAIHCAAARPRPEGGA